MDVIVVLIVLAVEFEFVKHELAAVTLADASVPVVAAVLVVGWAAEGQQVVVETVA